MLRVTRCRQHQYRLTLLAALLAAAPVQAAVYRCEATDGSVAFAQFPCRRASEVKVIAITPVNVIADSTLTAHEHRGLAQLDARLNKRAHDRRKTNQRRHRQLTQDNAKKAESCAHGQQQMEQLRDSKRHGYRLRDSAQLDEKQNQLRRAIERDC